MTNKNDHKIIDMALAVIHTEEKAIAALKSRISDDFIKAHKLLLNCKGRIIVTGIGKSGHIGNKIASTLASTGSPSIFIHPAEAAHGDLGMITKDDVMIVLSYSGETAEILSIVSIIKLLGIPIISMTGNPHSSIAQFANVNLDIHVEQEACPLQLAPTSSTTATLAMGDALAITLLSAKGFTQDDFARSHPGGTLGKKLLSRVSSLMHCGDTMPIIHENTPFVDALKEISRKRLGLAIIINDNGTLVGVFTDGDIRRSIEHSDLFNDKTMAVSQIMTKNPRTITADILATEALNIMEQFKITALPVVDHQLKPVGLLHMHDILKAGIL